VGQFQSVVGAGARGKPDAGGEFTGSFANPAQDQELMSNYGLIDVLERNRIGRNRLQLHASNVRATRTSRLHQLPPGSAYGDERRPQQGDIVGQSSTFRFQSGMENHGNFKFTGGTNIVSGNISNCAAGDPVCVGSTVGRGLILITGQNTSVTFEDNVYNSGTFQIDSPEFAGDN
jgi:hypothetical protein